MENKLTISALKKEALNFCKTYSGKYSTELFGITDGKAVGTFVEHLFQDFIRNRYNIITGNTANGLDLPSLNTDIKVTSIRQPQSSCPYKDSRQKIFGLGYNLLVFVYQKHDDVESKQSMLEFVSCSFISKERTTDYQTTTGITKILENNGNKDDIFAFLIDHNIPGDEISLYSLAEEIFANPPKIGYLTISNALQWRLQYGRIVMLDENIDGISFIVKYHK